MRTGQQTAKCCHSVLDMSRDPPPSVEEVSQTSPEERAEQRGRFESRSTGHVVQGSSAQSNNRENETSPEESTSKLKDTEMERGETPRRRIAGKRTVEEDAHVHAKIERIECTDRSLARPLPEASQPAGIDTELRLRLRGKRQADDSQVDQSKRPCVNELPIVPWSASSGEKHSLDVDEGKQQKKQCISERDEQLSTLMPPLLDDQDEILWCELMGLDESFTEEWSDESEGYQGVITEQLVQGVAKKGNERGANVHD